MARWSPSYRNCSWRFWSNSYKINIILRTLQYDSSCIAKFLRVHFGLNGLAQIFSKSFGERQKNPYSVNSKYIVYYKSPKLEQQFFELIDFTFFTGMTPLLYLLYNATIRSSWNFCSNGGNEKIIRLSWIGLSFAIRLKFPSVSFILEHSSWVGFTVTFPYKVIFWLLVKFLIK